MNDVFTEAFVAALVSGAILAGMPLLLGGLGEMISERAGVLNVGLEGMMLFAAYVSFVVAYEAGSIWLGLLAGIFAGMVASLVMVVLCVRRGLDQIVIGIALTLSMEGVTSLLQGAQYGTTYPRLGNPGNVAIPLLSDLPVVGSSVFDQHPIVYLTVLILIGAHWLMTRSTIGLAVRATGEKPQAVDAAGVDVARVRTGAVLACGALGGLGGAYLSVVSAGVFVPFMTHGVGFMAIVVAMLSRGRTGWVVVGALLFGVASSVQTALQIAGVDISTDVVNMLPFVAVIVALILFGRRSYLPATLGIPYVRGVR
jgi:simple sugar transport system permease protein